MKKLLLFITFILISGLTIKSQNLVGCHISEIKETMKSVHPAYILDDGGLNNPKNISIKYKDPEGDITMIFFLSKYSYCKYSKFIIDNLHKENTVETLDNNFEPKGNAIWLEHKDKKNYLIKLIESEWFFTLVTVQKKD